MSEPQAPPLEALLREQSRFLGFLSARLRDPSAADDVLQDAYVKAMARLDALEDPEAVVPWFFQVLRHALVDHARRTEVRTRQERAAASRPAERADDEALHDAVCQCVLALLPALPGDQAEILRRVELEGARVTDVASMLGLTANAAGVRLHRARRALAAALSGMCGACARHGCRSCQCRHPRPPGPRDP